MVKSADRSLDILEFCAGRSAGVTHAEIAVALAIPKSSTSALLGNLARRGYLLFDAERRSFRLGPGALALAGAYLKELDLARLAEPVVRGLAEALQESAALAVPSGTEVVVICRHNWMARLSYTLQVGDRAPLAASASGKAILLALPAAERAQLLAGAEWPRLARRSPASPQEVARELAAAERSGIAEAHESLIDGIVTAAAPVLDQAGRPVGALSASIPTPRLKPRWLARARAETKRAAAALSAMLASPPHPQAAASGRVRAA